MAPDPYRFPLRLPAEMFERLRKLAFARRQSINAVLVEAARDYLDRTETPEDPQ